MKTGVQEDRPDAAAKLIAVATPARTYIGSGK